MKRMLLTFMALIAASNVHALPTAYQELIKAFKEDTLKKIDFVIKQRPPYASELQSQEQRASFIDSFIDKADKSLNIFFYLKENPNSDITKSQLTKDYFYALGKVLDSFLLERIFQANQTERNERIRDLYNKIATCMKMTKLDLKPIAATLNFYDDTGRIVGATVDNILTLVQLKLLVALETGKSPTTPEPENRTQEEQIKTEILLSNFVQKLYDTLYPTSWYARLWKYVTGRQ